ncbi:hypothetical protein BGY98DRAFT_1187206 [Russula aff. rugulosa BPL654]|nr:hypothetical protein BGY98DRAFT_1187206 [Russula aff. rugulosa BPL654]
MSVPLWEPGTQYNYGDIVEYRIRYKITNLIGLSVVGLLLDAYLWIASQKASGTIMNRNYNSQDVHQPDDCSWHPDQTVIVPREEQKKKWRDLDEDRRKQLKIGGGLMAGAATIDAGYHAWDENKGRSEEEKQALTWGLQRWQRDAYVRTEEFRNHGPRAPTTWVLVDGRDNIPKSAIEAGKDKDGHPMYFARVYYEDSIEIGKASPLFKEGSAVGYYNRVIEFNKFEVLIGDPRAIRWVACRKKLNVQELNATPVEGGTIAKDGGPLYLTRVRYGGGVHAAKVAEQFMGSILAFGGKEVLIDDYEVLCLN